MRLGINDGSTGIFVQMGMTKLTVMGEAKRVWGLQEDYQLDVILYFVFHCRMTALQAGPSHPSQVSRPQVLEAAHVAKNM